jgi:hypothetical protein
MRLCVRFLLLLALPGCVLQPYIPPASTAHYKSQLAGYVGKNIADLPPSFGTPGPPLATADGGKKVSWPNTPRWGCFTTAVADSSGTIRSWDVVGASCLADYTDEELRQIKDKLIALSAFVRRLQRGQRIRLSFYEGAVDTRSQRADKPLACYFVSYSRLAEEITVRESPAPKHGFTFAKDLTAYELSYISDIAVLGPAADKPE